MPTEFYSIGYSMASSSTIQKHRRCDQCIDHIFNYYPIWLYVYSITYYLKISVNLIYTCILQIKYIQSKFQKGFIIIKEN